MLFDGILMVYIHGIYWWTPLGLVGQQTTRMSPPGDEAKTYHVDALDFSGKMKSSDISWKKWDFMILWYYDISVSFLLFELQVKNHPVVRVWMVGHFMPVPPGNSLWNDRSVSFVCRAYCSGLVGQWIDHDNMGSTWDSFVLSRYYTEIPQFYIILSELPREKRWLEYWMSMHRLSSMAWGLVSYPPPVIQPRVLGNHPFSICFSSKSMFECQSVIECLKKKK